MSELTLELLDELAEIAKNLPVPIKPWIHPETGRSYYLLPIDSSLLTPKERWKLRARAERWRRRYGGLVP